MDEPTNTSDDLDAQFARFIRAGRAEQPDQAPPPRAPEQAEADARATQDRLKAAFMAAFFTDQNNPWSESYARARISEMQREIGLTMEELLQIIAALAFSIETPDRDKRLIQMLALIQQTLGPRNFILLMGSLASTFGWMLRDLGLLDADMAAMTRRREAFTAASGSADTPGAAPPAPDA